MGYHRRHYRGGYTPIYIRVILILVACLAFGCIFIYANILEENERKELKKAAEEYAQDAEEREAEYSFTLLGGNVTEEDDFLVSAYDVLTGEIAGEVVVGSETFYENATVVSAYRENYASVFMDDISCVLEESDIAVFQFKACTESGPGWLEVSYGEDSVSVWVSETAATYYIPVVGAYDISEICFKMDASDFVKTIIDEVYLVKYTDTAITDLRVGVYSEFECDTTIIEAENYEIDVEATQCLVNNGYLYALSDGSLIVYRILDDGYEKVEEYSGMGETRDMAFSEDKNGIVITARLNGMYLFDISDPESLTLASHYATLEHSTGVYVSGNCAFVCSRYFGIEIVDISDIYNPVYVNQVGASSEYQDCFVSDGYLYVGVYGQKRIDIYNIKDLSNPSLCSQISLDGNGQGVFVSDGVLYAATGRDSADAVNSSSDLSDYGKGTGNGLEIYDVSDPANPVHISTVKTLGRLSYGGSDVWDVVVSDGYAYLCSRYNGLYVFDVSNPASPICVDIYQIEASADSQIYESMDSETYAFSYNTESISRGCIYHVWLQEGYLYAVASNMGIYKIEADYIIEIDSSDTFGYSVSKESVLLPSVVDCKVELYESETSIYAVAAYEDYYYLACGDGGISVLDGNLAVISHYSTSYAVLDIKAAGGYLFTAESEGGIGIWAVSGSTIERISTYCPSANKCYSSVVATEDGNYLLAQIANGEYALVNVTNKYNPVSAGASNTGVGTMYYRNLCSGVAGNYLCAYGNKLQCWYYYDGSSLNYLRDISNSFYSEYSGMCAVGDKAVYIRSGGYYYYDPATDETSSKITIDDVTLKGKCFSNGTILVVVDEYSGDAFIVNVADIDSPYCIAQFSIDGNSDVGVFDGNYLLIPCRNYGLLKIDISAYIE